MKRRIVSVLAAMLAVAATGGLPGAATASSGRPPAVRPASATSGAFGASAEPGRPLGGVHLPAQQWGSDHAYRIVYLTTGPRGGLIPATGLLFLPDGPVPDAGWPVVSWAHGTTGMGHRCGPSVTGGATTVAPDLVRFADAGYAAVATDYIGLSPESRTAHPYLNGATEADAVIDIVRAARALSPKISRTWAAAGSSQGGHAALATAHRASSYAPELDFRGAVAMAPPSNLDRIIPLARPGVPDIPPLRPVTGTLMAVLAGMAGAQDEVDVHAYLTPEGEQVVERISASCAGDWDDAVGGAAIGALVSRPLSDPAFARALHDYTAVPTAGYDRPILIIQGTRDTTVPPPMTQALLAQMAEAGTEYEFETIDTGHHDLRRSGGIDLALKYFGDIMPQVQATGA